MPTRDSVLQTCSNRPVGAALLTVCPVEAVYLDGNADALFTDYALTCNAMELRGSGGSARNKA